MQTWLFNSPGIFSGKKRPKPVFLSCFSFVSERETRKKKNLQKVDLEKCKRKIRHGLGVWKNPKEKSETTDLEKFAKGKKNSLGKMEKLEKSEKNFQKQKKMEKSENQPNPPKENGKV